MNLSDLYSAQGQALSHRKPTKIPLSAMIHAELPAKRELGAYQARTNLAREELAMEKGIAEDEAELGRKTLATQKRQGDISTGISAIGTGIQGAYTLSQLSKMGWFGKGKDFREGASGYDVAGSGVHGGYGLGDYAVPMAAGAGVGYGVAKLTKSTPAGVAAGAATTIALSEPARNFVTESVSELIKGLGIG
jgi:hypothetical protein